MTVRRSDPPTPAGRRQATASTPRVAALAVAAWLLVSAGCSTAAGAQPGPQPSAVSSPNVSPTSSATPVSPVTTTPTRTAVLPDPPPEAREVRALAATGLVLERAPIEALNLRVAGSTPPQHYIDVTSGLPNGCAHFFGYE